MAGWEQAAFDLEAVLGEPPDQVALRFTACDEGDGSLTEAMVDDVLIAESRPDCESPLPRPRLTIQPVVVGDSDVLGGFGNGNGWLDPDETVREEAQQALARIQPFENP